MRGAASDPCRDGPGYLVQAFAGARSGIRNSAFSVERSALSVASRPRGTPGPSAQDRARESGVALVRGGLHAEQGAE